MPKTKKITQEQLSEIKKYRKKNHDTAVDKRLRAVQLRGESLSDKEIAKIVEAHPTVVSRWICKYLKDGITAILKGHYGGNRRNLSLEEETEFIDQFKEKAAKIFGVVGVQQE